MPLKLYLTIIIAFCVSFSKGQTCQNLGEPIININFGAGTNPGPAETAVTSNYNYLATDCPYDGTYSVRNRTDNCSDNTWFNVQNDHTGNSQGYFLLINASNLPGAFFKKEVGGLCSNTTYHVSSWFLNVLSPGNFCTLPNNPDISFLISNAQGALIDSFRFVVPMMSSPQWKEYGFSFTTPANTEDIIIELRMNNAGGCGNDFAMDDLQLRACAPSISSSISGVVGDSTLVCAGTVKNFSLNTQVTSGFNHPVYQWQKATAENNWQDITGENNAILEVNINSNMQPAVLHFRALVAESGNLASVHCRIPAPDLTIEILPQPNLNLRSNQPVCEEQNLVLQSGGTASEIWQGPGGFNAPGCNVTIEDVRLKDSGWYWVTSHNSYGCSNRDSVFVTIHPAVHASISTTYEKICADEIIDVQVDGGTQINWSPTTNISSIANGRYQVFPPVTTDYFAVVSNGAFCKDSVSLSVIVTPHPVANAGPDRVRIGYEPVQLLGESNDPSFIVQWSPAVSLQNPQSLHPFASPAQDQDYVLTLFSPDGCGADSDTVKVSIFNDLYIPNAFTPNGDGKNDCWRIAGLTGFNNYRVRIYDRWSNLIYDVRDMSKGWDGTIKGVPLQNGTYSYFIQVEGRAPRKGTVTLIR